MQGNNDIWTAFRPFQAAGQRARAQLGRRIAFAAWPSVFDRLDYDDDTPFLLPALFSSVLAPDPAQGICDALAQYAAAGRDWRLNHGARALTPDAVLIDDRYPNVARVLGNAGAVGSDLEQLLLSALQLLEKRSRTLFNTVFHSVRYVFPFAGARQNSFAHELFPGVIFLNVSTKVTRISLLEDIAHQGMHCVFSDVEHSERFSYVVDDNSPISDFIDGPSSGRTISVLYHSALTEIASLVALSNAQTCEDLTKCETTELVARIGFLLHKAAIDFRYIDRISSLSEAAQALYAPALDRGKTFLSSAGDEFSHLSYSKQPYNFSLAVFEAENDK